MKFTKSGLFGEYLTIACYKIKLYNIIAHRKKTVLGEIDIVAQRGSFIAFIEVKTRTNYVEDMLCKIKQQKRIKRAAEIFLQQNPCYASFNVRFDLSIIRPWKIPVICYNAF
jgi:putative endonuclease